METQYSTLSRDDLYREEQRALLTTVRDLVKAEAINMARLFKVAKEIEDALPGGALSETIDAIAFALNALAGLTVPEDV